MRARASALAATTPATIAESTAGSFDQRTLLMSGSFLIACVRHGIVGPMTEDQFATALEVLRGLAEPTTTDRWEIAIGVIVGLATAAAAFFAGRSATAATKVIQWERDREAAAEIADLVVILQALKERVAQALWGESAGLAGEAEDHSRRLALFLSESTQEAFARELAMGYRRLRITLTKWDQAGVHKEDVVKAQSAMRRLVDFQIDILYGLGRHVMHGGGALDLRLSETGDHKAVFGLNNPDNLTVMPLGYVAKDLSGGP